MTATITAMKLMELHHNAVPMPPMEIATAASDGPMILPEVPLRVRQSDGGDEVLPRHEVGQS